MISDTRWLLHLARSGRTSAATELILASLYSLPTATVNRHDAASDFSIAIAGNTMGRPAREGTYTFCVYGSSSGM